MGRPPIHGMSGAKRTPTYISWVSMLQRTTNKRHTYYKHYGGRGIGVEVRWRRFENFLQDMGERPKGKKLDRIDNTKGYSKENCRWSTQAEQNRNMRTNVKFNGETAAEASRRLGGNRMLVVNRIINGWPLEKAFTVKAKV